MTDHIGQGIKATAAKRATTTRGAGTDPRKQPPVSKFITRVVSRRQADLAAEQAERDAAQPATPSKGQGKQTAAEIHAAQAGFPRPERR